MLYHNESSKNATVPLHSTVQNSYIAEVRALAEALVTAEEPTAIFCDCKSVVDQAVRFQEFGTRPVEQPLAADLWELIYLALESVFPRSWIIIKWIPGHLDEQVKTAKREKLIREGYIDYWDIFGNSEADKLADAAARRHRTPTHFHNKAETYKEVTCTIQKHLVRSWLHWCDLHRVDKLEDDHPIGSASSVCPLELCDRDLDCQGQFLEDWEAHPLGEDDPFDYLPPEAEVEDDLPFGLLLTWMESKSTFCTL